MTDNPRTKRSAGSLGATLTITTITAALAFTTVAGPALADPPADVGIRGDSIGAVYSPAHPGPAVNTTGTLPDGATWMIEKPADWNGTLLLFSHGMVAPGEDNPAVDSFDPITGKYLLDHGFALAGSSYATTGFAMKEALADQADVIRIFRQQVATPTTTIAWGASLGGAVTARLLELHPELVDGGMPMCGVVAGGVGLMDSYLDTLFALKTLIAPDTQLVNLGDTLFDQIGALQGAIEVAQGTPEGRARIALAASIGDFPGWAHADNPRPAPGDIDTQQAAQFEHMMELAFFGLALGADIEAKSGGNPATNVGVDYANLLNRSNGRAEVQALYQRDGLNLKRDLKSLAKADRIAANLDARANLAHISSFTGKIADPVLTLHTAGDQLAVVEQESAYAATIKHAGRDNLLRQAYTERAFHCAFTPAEIFSGLTALEYRVRTGSWKGVADAKSLQAAALALGPDLNVHVEDDPTQPIPTDPKFTKLQPGPFPRPFDDAQLYAPRN